MKLYVVTREDLPPGAQIAQSVHAVAAFSVTCPKQYERWVNESNNLVCLSAPDESALEALWERLDLLGIETADFHEPDFDDEMTAVAVESAGGKYLSNLPLALRQSC